MKIILFTLFIFNISIIGQTDWHRWKASDFTYRNDIGENNVVSADTSSAGIEVVSFFQNAYYFLFSNYDGDNCPFYPTCSHFFVEAVKATNIIQGALMFADRFTRDTNFFKSHSQYKIISNGRLFDPVYLYVLDMSKIKLEWYFEGRR